tara:strand:- start:1166 stop:1294 length:129 start_codon:yes stop_codon:yes gene_type:complete
MNTGIFLAGIGIFIYCVTSSAIDITYFLGIDPAIFYNKLNMS